MVSHLLRQLREFPTEQVRGCTFELHSDFAGRKLWRIFEKYMDVFRIHSHANYPHIKLFGNIPDDLLASYRNLTKKQGSSELGAKNHMISEKRYRMAVMTQAPAFVFLISFGFHKASLYLAK